MSLFVFKSTYVSENTPLTIICPTCNNTNQLTNHVYRVTERQPRLCYVQEHYLCSVCRNETNNFRVLDSKELWELKCQVQFDIIMESDNKFKEVEL